MTKAGPFFTQHARQAAADSRRRRALIKADTKSEYKAFVVRADNSYSWEIRRFGAIAVTASDRSYVSVHAAYQAGMLMMVSLGLDQLKNASTTQHLSNPEDSSFAVIKPL